MLRKSFKSIFKYTVFALFLCGLGSELSAQENRVVMNRDQGFNRASSYFDQKLYAHASDVYNQRLEHPPIHPFGEYEKLKREAVLTAQIADLRLEHPKASTQLAYYINEFYPDPITIQPILELASFYYYERNYGEAISWYDKVNIKRLPAIDASEASFKKGYCHFVQKEFKEAKRILELVKDNRNVFYYPTNYYYGMSQYFLKEFDEAINSFKKVSHSSFYGDYIPYYLSQIYFSQKKYDNLISYAEQKITDPNVKNKKEIRLLLGQTYYIRSDYERALKHLEFYEANTEKLTIEEFYQLAFTQYKLGKYEKAKENFEELTYIDGKLGQLSNYYLADSYIKLGDKQGARSVFKKVSQMDYDLGMQNEALYNYGKISAELGYEREAINVLTNVKSDSPFHKESQEVIYDILVNSADFENSISILESLPSLSFKLQSIYQSLSLKLALQELKEENKGKAEIYFDKSLQYKNNRVYEAQAYYWKAKIAYSDYNFEKVLSNLEQYYSVANGLNDLPEEAASYMAHYLAAYAHLKTGNINKAELDFKNTIVGVNINGDYINNEYIINRVLPDATIRTADCLFKQRKYEESISFYDRVIDMSHTDKIYAMYQKGLVHGLLDQPYEKIITLEKITSNFPESEFYDDAFNQIGETQFNLGKADPAAEAYIALMENCGAQSPYYNNAILKLGLINFNRGDMAKALTYYKSVFGFNPSAQHKVEAVKAIEEIYINNYGDSKAYFEYLDSIPGYTLGDYSKDSLTYHIAYQQYVKQEYKTALGSFNDYIDRFSGGFFVSDARFYRGEIYSVAQVFDKALVDYEYFIENKKSGPNYEDALRKAAIIADEYSGDNSKALKYYTLFEALSKNEENKQKAQFGAMEAAFELGQDDNTILYANKVSQNILSTKEEQAKALYCIGKVAYKNKKYDQAEAAFNQMTKLSNDAKAAEAKYLVAKIYFEKGNTELAEKQCNFINESSLNYPYWVAKSILLLADIYLEKDDLINARAALEAVVDNFSNNDELLRIANEKLRILEKKEEDANRIKVEDPDLLELDTIGGN